MQHLPAQQDAPPVVGVIDPDPVARNGLRTLLHGLGIDVCTYDSAETYLLAANGRHLGCLIVELLLPGMSGLPWLPSGKAPRISSRSPTWTWPW
jgi:FixJ family two-component response regulator